MEEAIKLQNISENRVKTKQFLPWFICGIAALFYSYVYYLRVAISSDPMQMEIIQNFHITATQFGLLNTAYYVAYTFMQIPVGFIIDRFDIRWVLFTTCFLIVAGVYLFMTATHFYIAVLGRFLIGLGSAFGYISVLKLATIWLPTNRFAFMAGLTTSFGKIAAMSSIFYITYAIPVIGFYKAMLPALFAGFVIMGLIFTFVRGKNKHAQEKHKITHQPIKAKELFKVLMQMLSNRQMWLIGLIGCFLYLPATVFVDTWGSHYLVMTHHIQAKDTDMALSLILFGWLISSPVIGAISDKIQKRRLPLIVTSITALIVILMVFYGPPLSKTTIYISMFIIGLSCGSHPLCFSLSKENNAIRYSGTATALTNAMVMTGGLFNIIVGKLLDWHFNGEIIDQVRVYTAADYRFALSIVPICFAIAIVTSFLIKETHCRLQED